MRKVFMCPVCANTGSVSAFKPVPMCAVCNCEQIRLKGFKFYSDWLHNRESRKQNDLQFQRYFKELVEPMDRFDRESLEFRTNYGYIFRVPIEYTPEELKQREEDTDRLIQRFKEKAAMEEATRPRCPTCTSTDIRKIGTAERGVSAVTLGVMSNKVGKTFQCNHCGYTW